MNQINKEICNICDGNGFIINSNNKKHICEHCRGNRDLDWLENIFGSTRINFHKVNEIETFKKIEEYMVNYLQKISKIYVKDETKQCLIEHESNKLLSIMKNNKEIYDYKINFKEKIVSDHLNYLYFSIQYKLYQTTEIFSCNFGINLDY